MDYSGQGKAELVAPHTPTHLSQSGYTCFFKTCFIIRVSYPIIKISITIFSIVAKISSPVRIYKLSFIIDEFASEVLIIVKS